MELRRFLDENKTDAQKYEDIKKELDKQTEELENNIGKFDWMKGWEATLPS